MTVAALVPGIQREASGIPSLPGGQPDMPALTRHGPRAEGNLWVGLVWRGVVGANGLRQARRRPEAD